MDFLYLCHWTEAVPEENNISITISQFESLSQMCICTNFLRAHRIVWEDRASELIMVRCSAGVKAHSHQAKEKAKNFFDVCQVFLWSLPLVLWSFSLSLSLSLGVNGPLQSESSARIVLHKISKGSYTRSERDSNTPLDIDVCYVVAHVPMGKLHWHEVNKGVYSLVFKVFIHLYTTEVWWLRCLFTSSE